LIIQKDTLYHEVRIINLLSFLLASLEFEQVRFITDSKGLQAVGISQSEYAAALGRVYELNVPKALLCREQEEVMTNPDLVLLEHHEMDMLNPLSSIVAHTLLEGDRIHDVADVFVDEGVSA